MRTRSFVLLLFALSVIFYFTLYREGKQPGEPAPDFSLPTEQRQVRLSDYRGQFVLINFWATWCPPCVAEMPSLERLHQRFQNESFEILAVSLDEDWASIRRFRQKIPLTLKILLDQGGEIASLYGTHQIPETYLVDDSGVIVKKIIGPRQWDDEKVAREIQLLLSSKSVVDRFPSSE